MNASNGQIEIYAPNSLDGQDVQQDMDNHSEYLRKVLKQKYNKES